MSDIQAVSSAGAPAAIGPYSQGVLCGGMLYTAGQIGLDPTSGVLAGADVRSQARQVLRNLKAVLAAVGLEYRDVVKTTVYLLDLSEFGVVNEVYGEVFTEPYPARCTVQVARLPKDARIEIDLIARRR